MIEYQPPVCDEAGVALQPIGLLPGVERAKDGGSLTQFGFDANACTDERLDAKRCGKPARLVEVEVAAGDGPQERCRPLPTSGVADLAVR
ncbi:MAG: hypothetical protein ACJAR2_000747 [Ilumatobacter sp.]|jgi:hypothetical protein